MEYKHEKLYEDSGELYKSLEAIIKQKEAEDFKRICGFMTILLSVGAALTTALILFCSGL